MIANFFNQTRPINFLLLSILVVLIYLAAIFNANVDSVNFFLVLKYGLFLFLAVLTVFVLNFIIRKNALTEDNSFAIFLFIIMCSYFPEVYISEGIYLSNFILLLAFRRIYSLRTSIQTREKIFDSAFWIGIAGLFYVWSLIYVLFLYAAILIFRKGN